MIDEHDTLDFEEEEKRYITQKEQAQRDFIKKFNFTEIREKNENKGRSIW